MYADKCKEQPKRVVPRKSSKVQLRLARHNVL